MLLIRRYCCIYRLLHACPLCCTDVDVDMLLHRVEQGRISLQPAYQV